MNNKKRGHVDETFRKSTQPNLRLNIEKSFVYIFYDSHSTLKVTAGTHKTKILFLKNGVAAHGEIPHKVCRTIRKFGNCLVMWKVGGGGEIL